MHLVSMVKVKDPSIRVKMNQTYSFLIFTTIFFYICWVEVIYLTCRAFLKSPWWPVWIFYALKYFMAHQYIPKIFHEPHKNPPPLPPSCILNVQSVTFLTLVTIVLRLKTVEFFFLEKEKVHWYNIWLIFIFFGTS